MTIKLHIKFKEFMTINTKPTLHYKVIKSIIYNYETTYKVKKSIFYDHETKYKVYRSMTQLMN